MAVPLAPTRLGSLVEQHRVEIVALVHRHEGRGIAVFGSVARGEDGPDSDIDFLVELAQGSSLFDLMRLEDDLTELLGCRIDVVSVGALLDRDDDIRADAVPL
ncbi:MAG: nucleotidyltransferase family protein [Geodermatophilaceae bacterium]|nr:nucleotidyltransferase family protein [Geodermatophilaceae bacterium]